MGRIGFEGQAAKSLFLIKAWTVHKDACEPGSVASASEKSDWLVSTRQR